MPVLIYTDGWINREELSTVGCRISEGRTCREIPPGWYASESVDKAGAVKMMI